MFAKSKQIGLVSLFVVLATALGGCAESMGAAPANTESNRPLIALSRFEVPAPELVAPPAKSDASVARFETAKRVARPVADVH